MALATVEDCVRHRRHTSRQAGATGLGSDAGQFATRVGAARKAVVYQRGSGKRCPSPVFGSASKRFVLRAVLGQQSRRPPSDVETNRLTADRSTLRDKAGLIRRVAFLMDGQRWRRRDHAVRQIKTLAR